MNLSAKNYALAAEPMSNVYGALYSTLATDDLSLIHIWLVQAGSRGLL